MEYGLNFKRDAKKHIDRVTKLPGADRIMSMYDKGLITLDEAMSESAKLYKAWKRLHDLQEMDQLTVSKLEIGDYFYRCMDEFDMVKPSKSLCRMEEKDESGYVIAHDYSIDHVVMLDDDTTIEV